MTEIDKVRAELSDYRYSDYLRKLPELRALPEPAVPLRVAVLRSYTLEPIEPVLDLRLRLEGFDPEFYFGGYDQYVQELLDETSGLYQFQPDIVLLMTRVEELMPDFISDFGEQTAQEWRTAMDEKATEIASLIGTFQGRRSAPVLAQNYCSPASPYWGIYDAQTADGQAALVGRLNRSLAEGLQGLHGAFVWDFEGCLRRLGSNQVFDSKMWYIAKSPYRQACYPGLVDDLLPYVLSALGRSKKCVVLDLDNTLWGGVIGEDGLEGIALGHNYPGSCYRDFQKALLRLHRRGIILAINSKNNEGDALEAIDRHPDMVLRREHFAAMQINWFDKASNLGALAETLNIGLDSMVMIDDNPVECEQIRQAIPECAVVCLPEAPYLIPSVADRLPGVENVQLTDEDKRKGEMYRAQIARREHAGKYGNLDEFLVSLEIEVSITPAGPYSVPRIAQLTQKTNQMNMTTRRYSETEISAMTGVDSRAAFSVASRDRFGDNGIVGVFILDLEDEVCRIDTFLLSCRVIGRKIEDAMVAFIADHARERGARKLVGEFLSTARNVPAEGMYEKLGFEPIGDTLFEADLGSCRFPVPDCIRIGSVGEPEPVLAEP